MKVAACIKKVKSHFKKQGIDIEIQSPRKGGSYKWSFQHNDHIGSFSVNGMQGWDPDALDGEATLFHVRRFNDHSDSQSDYFAGSFRSNITQVCKSLLPDPSKFPAGSLVRGKTNKRATRHGIAGQVGLVMRAADGYCDIRWVGMPEPRWKLTYSERDLELVS